MGHVLGLEMMLADRAADDLLAIPTLPWRARDVETALRRPGDQRRHDEGDSECKERRQGLHRRAENPGERRDAGDSRREHCADADRIDVVKVRALELDPRRA